MSGFSWNPNQYTFRVSTAYVVLVQVVLFAKCLAVLHTKTHNKIGMGNTLEPVEAMPTLNTLMQNNSK